MIIPIIIVDDNDDLCACALLRKRAVVFLSMRTPPCPLVILSLRKEVFTVVFTVLSPLNEGWRFISRCASTLRVCFDAIRPGCQPE